MKIKVITVATQEHPRLNDLRKSCVNTGMDLTVLGLGEPWQGFGMKVILTREYLKTLTGYTHFIFVDAYDVLFLKPVTDVPDKILFSAEKQCWPDVEKAGDYPNSPHAWKYLNSGSYSAPIDLFLKITDDYPLTMADDDQRYFTKIYLDYAKEDKIELDIHCNLFQSYAFISPGDFTITTTLINNIASTEPSIIHFNGKCHEPKIYAMIKYNTLKEVQDIWQDNEFFAKELNEGFIERVNAIDQLKDHRTFVEQHIFGFGERSFHWMWNLIIQEMPKEFTFLEIGVFKGQTLSLCRLLADMQDKKVKRYGVTPLSTEGGMWESDYDRDIKLLHDTFSLEKDYTVLKGLSEEPEIIKEADKLKLDVLYIDGGHEERHITNDIVNYAHLVKPGGYMVIDDCCNTFQQPWGYFCGIEAVTKVVDEMLPPNTQNSEWQFCFSVVHNRIYKKL